MKAAIAYIPVIHKGHREFCQKVKPDVLYVLGRSILAKFPVLERDVRALPPEEIVVSARALSLAPKVEVLEEKNITGLSGAEIVFAEDEVTRALAAEYFKDKPVSFERVFLRWDKMGAVTSYPVSPDIVISKKDFGKKLIELASKEAEKSSDWWRQVGAILVKDGEVILSNFNAHKPTENAPNIDGDPRSNLNAGEGPGIYTSLHAEAGIIAEAARKGISLEGASLYLTTFPCSNCATQIAETGIKEIYFAGGYSNLNGERNLKAAGIKIIRVSQ